MDRQANINGGLGEGEEDVGEKKGGSQEGRLRKGCSTGHLTAAEEAPAAVRRGRGVERHAKTAKHTQEGLRGREEYVREGDREGGSNESRSRKGCSTGAFSVPFEVYKAM